MQFILDLTNILPAQLDFGSVLLFLGAFCLGILALTLVFRLFFGKGSGFSRAISSALGILLVYLATVLIYTFRPGNFARFLSPLPFVTFSADRLILFSFTNAAFPDICRELLSMIVLAFLVNLTDSFIADGKKMLTWLISRFLTVLGAMAVHYGVNVIILNFLPDVLYQYAPMILFCILIFMLSLGVLKTVLGIFLTALNPILGAMYAFFFSSRIGRRVSRAVLSTLVLSLLVFTLEYLGYSVIPIGISALQAYAPALVIILLLWYTFDKI